MRRTVEIGMGSRGTVLLGGAQNPDRPAGVRDFFGRLLGGGGTSASLQPVRLIVPLVASTLPLIHEALGAVSAAPHDLVEWRVDHLSALRAECSQHDTAGDVVDENRGENVAVGESFAHEDSQEDSAAPVDSACWERARAAVDEALSDLLMTCDVPLIATVRTRAQGGEVDLSVGQYGELVRFLAAHGADAVDVEYGKDATALVEYARECQVTSICSTHDFEKTPSMDEMRVLLQRMVATGADIVKLAVYAHTSEDAQRVHDLQEWAMVTLETPAIILAMSEAGRSTRLTPMQRGGVATFVTVGAASAPGQVSAIEAYRILSSK